MHSIQFIAIQWGEGQTYDRCRTINNEESVILFLRMSILKSDITPALINQIIENSLCFNLNVWHVDHPTHQID